MPLRPATIAIPISTSWAPLRPTRTNVVDVLKTMLTRGLSGVVLTGTVFEQDEGAGDAPLRAFSPYGLSKGLTWQYYRFLSQTMGFPLGKFVIPNPFGPFEEPRFCNYLVQTWFKGEVPAIRTPLYVRDNIHVDLLAHSYAAFASAVPAQKGIIKLNPSFYVESQGAFANRFANGNGAPPRHRLPYHAAPAERVRRAHGADQHRPCRRQRFWLERSRSLGCRSGVLQSSRPSLLARFVAKRPPALRLRRAVACGAPRPNFIAAVRQKFHLSSCADFRDRLSRSDS